MADNPRETFNDHPVYTLSEIAMSLHRVVERTYPQPYYIKAEVLKLNFYPHSGHCYPELVEKENNAIKAEMRAIIWSSNYQRINQRFEQITGERLKEDISILCLASIEFSPKHGLALHIQDIEPTYYEITDGAWTGNNRYGVVHRIASDGSEKGIGQFCINWAFEQCGHLRMDTHTDNVIMQKLLTKLGFTRCGIIYVVEDDYPRYAYEK